MSENPNYSLNILKSSLVKVALDIKYWQYLRRGTPGGVIVDNKKNTEDMINQIIS
jgi:hypothetical protein